MAVEIKLPELGEGVEAAQVLSVLVKPGDAVRKDQTVIEVETDKATAEVPSDFAGTVAAVLVKEGERIQVGQTIVTLEGAGSADAAASAGSGAADAARAAPAPGTASAPAAASSNAGAASPKAAAASTTRPAAARPAIPAASKAPPRPAGTAPRAESPAPPDAPVEIPRKILYLDESDAVEVAPGPAGIPVAAAPSVRRLARELGVEIAEVPGSGPGGRISADDVKNFARHLIARRPAAEPARPAIAPVFAAGAAPRREPKLPDFTQWGEVERVPMTTIRRATVEAMSAAWATVPMVTQFDRADVTALEEFRARHGKRAEAAGAKLTVTAIAVRIAAAALRAFPKFNASLDVEREEIVEKRYVNVGVAVDTERGLMVPVIRDADRKSVVEIAVELAGLAERARARKIGLEELRGGTFSISNLGGLGTTYFSPIVNWPEVAILGLGRSSVEPVWRDGAFVPRTILPLAVTYDHRLIDGADAARFLRWIAEAMENPLLVLLESHDRLS